MLAQLAIKNKKECQTKRISMRFANTSLSSSFQIAHIRTCKHSCHNFLGILPDRNGLQEAKRIIIVAGTAVL